MKQKQSRRALGLSLLLLLLMGCRQEALTPVPAPAPVETDGQPSPTASRDVEEVATEEVATEEGSRTPGALSITTPAADVPLALDSRVSVAGEAPAGSTISVTLRAAGLTLAENSVTLEEGATSWQSSLDIPGSVTGSAVLRARIEDGAAVEQPVLLARTSATSATTIVLSHPQIDSPTAAGNVLFFTGQVHQPGDGMMTIALLYEDCQTEAASQSFGIKDGGLFWGYVAIPDDVVGPACAVAYTGEFAQEGWQAGHTPITILEADDPAARALFIGNFPNSVVAAGETVRVYGSALNLADKPVTVTLEVEGVTVAESSALVDSFGYWETELLLPAGTSPAASGEFVVRASDSEGELSYRVPFDVVTDSNP